MIRVKPFFYLSILFCVICSSIYINAQEIWNGKSIHEVVMKKQIPEAALSDMATEELIQEYLNSLYPRYLFLYPDDTHYAFEKACNDFNGLRELLKRQDAGKKLIELYQSMDPGAYDVKWDPVKKGEYSFYFIFVEVLLSQESILDNFTKSETKTVLNELLKKNELKSLHPGLYSTLDIKYNTYSMAKLLDSKGKDNGFSQRLSRVPGISYLLNNGILVNNEIPPVIIQNAKEFVNTY
jgi:hypothetical protein